VEAAAARWPDAIAVTDGTRRLSYRELDHLAERAAARLRHVGVGPEVVVGLYLERSIEMIVALLGILKAGGAYLPIDPVYPPERIEFILRDGRALLVLTEPPLAARLSAGAPPVSLIADLLAQPAPDTPPQADSSLDHAAYVIYTSGSTGQPKGVAVTHANAAWLFESMDDHFEFGPDDAWTFFHSIAFDFSVWEIWGALIHGGRVVVVPYVTSRSPEAFHELLVQERVTVLNQTPSAFRQLMAADEAKPNSALALRYVIFGGEALDPRALRSWFARHGDAPPRLVNMYGITETTVFVTHRPLSADDTATTPLIGRPLRDSQVLLLDEQMRPVPAGEVGEMWIGGDGVARGYLDRPELNAQRFVTAPSDHSTFNHQLSTRLYRSGDLARQLPDGELEYLGRVDQQVKLRGFRVELGEIEARLREAAPVSDCAVILREDTPGDHRLVAYVVLRDKSPFDASAVRQALHRTLPAFMVPAAFVPLAALPLTGNGKLDHRALPAPPKVEAAAPAAHGTIEQQIAAIWRQALNAGHVGLDENFFDLGAHSLLLLQVRSELHRLLGCDLLVTALFQNPTIRTLARHLRTRGEDTATPATQQRAERQRAAFAARRARNLDAARS
jgi:amino acid adenylation domain-containing protein